MFSNIIGIFSKLTETFKTIGEKPTVLTSLALFFPALSDKSIWFKLFNRFDVFTIWELVLISIGLGIVANFSTKKSAIIGFSLWIMWVIITVLGYQFLPTKGVGM
jgi:hypothetical protein